MHCWRDGVLFRHSSVDTSTTGSILNSPCGGLDEPLLRRIWGREGDLLLGGTRVSMSETE